ncbi:MAG: phosphonate ABC transporter, permease protein PhnE [Desulfobacteraceae bacterium]|nr:phosphonate ABC transporter, permease protein PhnE [Desulfobacteraceae bacterium]
MNHSIRIRPVYLLYVLVLFLVIGSLYFILIIGTDWGRIGSPEVLWANILRFFPPNLSSIVELGWPTLDTLIIAVFSTLLTAIICFPVIWLSSRNVTPHKLAYILGRVIIITSRSIHEIIWGLFFVIAVGLGALPGILALSLRGIGFVAKVVSEEVEAIDPKPVEAIRATGANLLKVILFAIVPQILPVFIGTLIFQWDVNLRRAAIIGVVGAGGLGLAFHQAMIQYKWRDATAILLVLTFLVIVGEVISRKIREKII